MHTRLCVLLIWLLSTHVSVAQKRPDNLDKLLKRSFDRGYIKSIKETPSHLGTILEGAAAGGDIELINELLDYGAPIEGSHDIAHWSPLNIAASYGQLEVVKLLVSRGANPNSKNKHDNNPICSAAYNRDKSIVYFLLSQGARVDDVVEEGNILLHIVCEAGWIDMAPMLITGRHSVMALNEFQRTPLHRLAGSCFFDKEKEPALVALATLLIEKGSDVVAQDYEGKTPLHLAARCGNNSIASALISAAASAVTMQDKNGQTALHYAVSPAPNIGEQRLKGTLNVIDVLLSKGLPIDIVDHKGRTPLHVAIMQKNTIAATLLIDRGANQYIQDHDGKKPADYLVDPEVLSSTNRF